MSVESEPLKYVCWGGVGGAQKLYLRFPETMYDALLCCYGCSSVSLGLTYPKTRMRSLPDYLVWVICPIWVATALLSGTEQGLAMLFLLVAPTKQG